MNDEWSRIEEIFLAALERKPESRESFARMACGGDASLNEEVLSLLASHERAEGFIENPMARLPTNAFSNERGDEAFDEAGTLKEGARVGDYRVIKMLGEGGMGEVYLAEDVGLRRKVALKFVKRGLATRRVLSRFRYEERILAVLNDSRIARLYGGATAPDGSPYFVMEYVEGERLDRYADTRALSMTERLKLFRKVCAAVQYAHQNLVIHRDLKPSNILVTADGEPKLLDFGIAKLLDAESDATGMRTITELGVMTPEYASPEQVQGLSVTTATDVYSLGVVLYELLTGERPYRLTSRRVDEIARAIVEQEPAKPSDSIAGQGSRIVNSRRDDSDQRTAIPKPKSLRGDLDNIILMALRKEPQRRYASVAQFSEDIRRHLEGLPVVARKDTFSYRASKFVHRNKISVAASALVLLALIGGIIATAWQASVARAQTRAANEQRDRAQRESAKAERINSFLQSIISYADPSWYASGRDNGGDVKFIEVVNGIAARIDPEFADQPEIRAELHHTIGNTYRALERFDTAVEHFRAALDASRAAYGAEHPKVARDLYFLAAGLHGNHDDASAETLFREAIRMMRATDAENSDLPYMLQDFGAILYEKGDTESSEPLLREALEMARRRNVEDNPAVAVSLDRLGCMYLFRGDLNSAETMLNEAIEHSRRSSNRQLLAWSLQNLSVVKIKKGDYAGAEASLLEALELLRVTVGDANPHTNGLRRRLVALYEVWKKPDLATKYRAQLAKN